MVPTEELVRLTSAIAQNEQRGQHGRRGCSCREAVISAAPTARQLTSASGQKHASPIGAAGDSYRGEASRQGRRPDDPDVANSIVSSDASRRAKQSSVAALTGSCSWAGSPSRSLHGDPHVTSTGIAVPRLTSLCARRELGADRSPALRPPPGEPPRGPRWSGLPRPPWSLSEGAASPAPAATALRLAVVWPTQHSSITTGWGTCCLTDC
jgi:hypothetical protein